VFGAIAQDDVKRILSFHIISQIGYMIFGLGLFTVAGLAAAVFYVVHHIIVKTALFLVGGLIEESSGTAALQRLGGLLHVSPPLAALFLIPALSLAGIPPFSGFVAKLTLIQAGLEIGSYVVVGVAIAVSALTLFSMLKIWSGVFWGTADEPPPDPDSIGRRGLALSRLMWTATGVVVAASVGFVIAAAPLYGLGQTAAAVLMDPTVYIEAVRLP
jgi:multicomponent Na+:H+ antiporter subunit D